MSSVAGNKSSRKISPRATSAPWIGLAVVFLYDPIVVGLQSLIGVPYDDWGKSAYNLFVGAGISLIVGTVILAALASYLGWWKPLLRDEARSKHRWPIIFPILTLLLVCVNLLVTDWNSYDTAFFAASVVLLLVGFTEEITYRGFLLVGLRSRLNEWWVWFLTSLAFGASHYVNLFIGSTIDEVAPQMFSAFLAGSVFYILRRTTGSLIYAMILHALWDFSVFAIGHGDTSAIGGLIGVADLLIGLLALIGVPFVIRSVNAQKNATPLEPKAT